MLNKLRKRLDPFLTRLALAFVSRGFSPNGLSLIGFFVSISAGIMYALSSHVSLSNYYFNTLIGGILLLIAGLFDILDGAVARVTNQISNRGAFLDSLLDKVAEVVVFISIFLGNLSTPIWCLIAISLSLLVSDTEGTCRFFAYPTNRHWDWRTCREITNNCPGWHDSSLWCDASSSYNGIICGWGDDCSKNKYCK